MFSLTGGVSPIGGSDLNTYTRVILSADKRGEGGYREREREMQSSR